MREDLLSAHNSTIDPMSKWTSKLKHEEDMRKQTLREPVRWVSTGQLKAFHRLVTMEVQIKRIGEFASQEGSA